MEVESDRMDVTTYVSEVIFWYHTAMSITLDPYNRALELSMLEEVVVLPLPS